MITAVSQAEYAKFRDYIIGVCGLNLPEDGDYLIRKNLSGLADENGCDSFECLYKLMERSEDNLLRDRITAAMIAHETGWFRDEACWSYLHDVAVPSLLARGAYGECPRVLSIGVSTGQEAYSLAILISEAVQQLTDRSAADKIEILGTDISSSALFLASAGRYDILSIDDGMGQTRLEQFFSSVGRTWVLNDKIRQRVKFMLFNPVDGLGSLGDFDLIFFRDLLHSYTDDFKKSLLSKLTSALKPGGILLTGRSEIDLSKLSNLAPGEYGGYPFFRKN